MSLKNDGKNIGFRQNAIFFVAGTYHWTLQLTESGPGLSSPQPITLDLTLNAK